MTASDIASQVPARRAPERTSWRTACVVLFVITLTAAYLRFQGYDALLPHASLPDARAIAQQIDLIRSGAAHPELDPSWGVYSHFVARVVAMLPAPDPSRARSLEEHLACASLVLVQVRLLSIVISILAVPAAYLLARHFLDRLRALFAAGLVATSLMFLSLSVAEKPHAIVTTFVLLGTLAALRLQRKPTLGSYALCGLAGAAALGALQNGLMILPAFVAAHVLRSRVDRNRAREWIGVVVALAILALGWHWFWPDRATRPPSATHADDPLTVTLTGQAIRLSLLDGTGAVRMVSELWGADPLLVVLGAIGLGIGLFSGLARAWKSNTWRPLAVVLACVVPYALVAGLYELTAGRYVGPLIPFVACIGATAIPRRFAAPAFVLLIVPLVPAWLMARLHTHPDTFEEATAFVRDHIPPDETIVLLPTFDLPLLSDEATTRANAALPWATPWVRYQAALDPTWVTATRRSLLLQPSSGTSTPRRHHTGDLSFFREHGARWVIVSRAAGPPELLEDMATLRTQATIVARFSPLAHDDGSDQWMPPTDPVRWPGPFPRAWRIFRARAEGPTIEVFRL